MTPPTSPACGARGEVRRLELLAVEGLPEVHPGDDLGELINARTALAPGDVVVVAQKVVSKSEGRLRDLEAVKASDEAVQIASQLVASPDPRLVQVVLDESVRVIRSRRVLITETRHGFVCANGGVDHSNIPGANFVSLLPEDPDSSAERIRGRLIELSGKPVGVVVSDTFGRPWRLGIVNVALGVAGLPALIDLRGTPDDSGRELHATVLAIADDVASAAGIVMRKTARVPAVIVRGLAIEGEGHGRDLVRPAAEDVFR
jgi:coenzyme F420-0:L-glutamate ligase/coenzyme F420-1:gamma-L-glutamate ligase